MMPCLSTVRETPAPVCLVHVIIYNASRELLSTYIAPMTAAVTRNVIAAFHLKGWLITPWALLAMILRTKMWFVHTVPDIALPAHDPIAVRTFQNHILILGHAHWEYSMVGACCDLINRTCYGKPRTNSNPCSHIWCDTISVR